MGSAVARALARAGLRVAGCDARQPPHDKGSSHGESRIIRAAYFEDPVYAPLARRAQALWRELEAESGRALLRVTGGLNIGPREGMLVRGALESARTHNIAHEQLDGVELQRRYAALRVAAHDVAVWEPDAGILDPEASVSALGDSARRAGAQLGTGNSMVSWKATGDGIQVRTAGGDFHARNLILALGAWLPAFHAQLPLRVTRQSVFWFETSDPPIHSADRLPHYLIEFEPGRVFYGFPDLGNGLKCAIHHEGADTSPDQVDRTLQSSEVEQVRALLERYIPRANGTLLRDSTCLYTNTPDGHFVIDRDPDTSGVWLFSACSGHGFKFAPAVAELLLHALAAGGTDQLGPFAADRFRAEAQS
jgi:sarcosine oxidase